MVGSLDFVKNNCVNSLSVFPAGGQAQHQHRDGRNDQRLQRCTYNMQAMSFLFSLMLHKSQQLMFRNDFLFSSVLQLKAQNDNEAEGIDCIFTERRE